MNKSDHQENISGGVPQQRSGPVQIMTLKMSIQTCHTIAGTSL